MNDKRIRRPEPERTQPFRSWSGMFDRQAERADDAQPGQGRSVEHDVAMGYRVIEDFMRRGVTAARSVSQPLGAPGGANSQLLERLFQSATDLGGVWLEMLQALWSAQREPSRDPVDPGGFELRTAPSPASEPSGSMSEDARTPATQSTPERPRAHPTITFRVSGGREVELSASVDPDIGAGPFAVHDLRALDPQLPRIGAVAFEFEPAAARGRAVLSIDARQPPGNYSGLIVDSVSNLPRGSISVRVL